MAALLGATALLAGASSVLAANDPNARFRGAPSYDLAVTNVRWEAATIEYSYVTFDLSWSYSWRASRVEPAKNNVTGPDLRVENWHEACRETFVKGGGTWMAAMTAYLMPFNAQPDNWHGAIERLRACRAKACLPISIWDYCVAWAYGPYQYPHLVPDFCRATKDISAGTFIVARQRFLYWAWTFDAFFQDAEAVHQRKTL